MTVLEKVLAEKYPPAPQARASPTPVNPVGATNPGVILAQEQRAAPMPKGRLGRSAADMMAGWWWPSDMLAGRTRTEVIALCRLACEQDSDAAGALRDIVALANPGYSLNFYGSDRAKKQAEREINQLEKRLGDFRSWDALINHQVTEAFMAGAGSLESFPSPSRSAVAGVEIVPAEEVTILREGNQRLYQQRQYGVTFDPRTYVYVPFDMRGRDPYGTPVMVSVLLELERKLKLINGTDKIIGMISDGPFLEIGVPKPTLSELGVSSERDPDYAERLKAYYRSYISIATSARDRGVMVVENGVESKSVPLTSSVQGIADLHALGNMRLWTGMMTLPFMRGKTEGTTQALAEVMYPILLSHAQNLQLIGKAGPEFTMNNHLRWAGIPASVEIEFLEPPNPFKESHAKARLAEAQADAIYIKELGEEYVRYVASREELDPEKIVAHREEQQANSSAPTTTGGQGEADGASSGSGKGGEN